MDLHRITRMAVTTSSDRPATLDPPAVRLMAGLADRNASLFRRIGLPLGDPAAWIGFPDGQRVGIVRDLELDRVRAANQLDRVCAPAEFQQSGCPLDGDRETAVAQAVAEFLHRQGIRYVVADRTLPFLFAWELTRRDITIGYDADLGVSDRRVKSEREIAALRQAQKVTEEVMRILCETIGSATADAQGVLRVDGHPLTSQRVRGIAATEFLARNFSMSHGAIVATLPDSADCHHAGEGELRTGMPVIVDLFPRDESTRYHGDCTRTVVHGTVSDAVAQMHAAVVAAKAAAESALLPGRTGAEVHQAAQRELQAAGYQSHRGVITDQPSIQHGTGHGIGLDIHEPILLDDGAGEILENEVFTVEPGLYGRRDGGVRVEDMVLVSPDGAVNFNVLPQGLSWT